MAVLALGISLYLSWSALVAGDRVAGCGDDGPDCHHVLASRWSRVFGAPVSLFSVLAYGGALAALFAVGPNASPQHRRRAWMALVVLATMMLLAALWFAALQAFVLNSYCLYCLTVHQCSLIVAVFVFWHARRHVDSVTRLAVLGVAGPAALVAAQVFFPTGQLQISEAGDLDLSAELDEDADESPPVAHESPLDTAAPKAADDSSDPAAGEKSRSSEDNRGGDDEEQDDRQEQGEAAEKPESSPPTFTLPLPSIAVPNVSSKDVPPALPSILNVFPNAAKNEEPSPEEEGASEDQGEKTDLHLPSLSRLLMPPTADSPDAPPLPALTAKETEKEETEKSAEKTTEQPAPQESPSPAATGPPAPVERQGKFLRNQLTLDLSRFPVLGSAESEFMMLKMFDYTCPHCRSLHERLEAARKRYGDRLAIVLAVVPLQRKCNAVVPADQPMHKDACAYASLAMAVWKSAPNRFEAYHNWLMAGSTPPRLVDARDRARKIILQATGQEAEAVDALFDADPAVARLIRENARLYKALRGGILPKLICGDRIAVGEPSGDDELFQFIETNTRIEPLDGTAAKKPAGSPPRRSRATPR